MGSGVAVTFGAPIGGVLFSIEVTTWYYATRNYWLAFFSSIWGGLTFILLWNLRWQSRTCLFSSGRDLYPVTLSHTLSLLHLHTHSLTHTAPHSPTQNLRAHLTHLTHAILLAHLAHLTSLLHRTPLTLSKHIHTQTHPLAHTCIHWRTPPHNTPTQQRCSIRCVRCPLRRRSSA
jgi:Voltage gated chloride channel